MSERQAEERRDGGRRGGGGGRGGDGEDRELSPKDEATVRKMNAEARALGGSLANGGRGGLPPKLVQGVFRRDGYQCKRCAAKEDLTIHHKGGVVDSEWLAKKGHKDALNNLVTLCLRCHDAVHDEARKNGTDSSQQEAGGGEGGDEER